MRANQHNLGGKIIPFRKPSSDRRALPDDGRSETILRMLDLSKFEQDRHAAGRGPRMRSNIAAMILLGLLVLVATEDFSRLEQSNLCLQSSECRN
jgi:hypothetical protein